jgi:hypothetical protein
LRARWPGSIMQRRSLERAKETTMADTIHLICIDCKQTLWVGQGGYEPPAKAYLYETNESRDSFRRFYDAHFDHDIRLAGTALCDRLDRHDDFVEFE